MLPVGICVETLSRLSSFTTSQTLAGSIAPNIPPSTHGAKRSRI